ncbi:hypothetical protein MAR_025744 [Mya arenaria]|uniref:Uncharacterized protein n=1 Tax=Mya arenaria TaxID=6604 RepID=A0ABY7ER06_MYAAR|nr:hypothetical protein MAR_025744 [Mya arenaria]
MGILRCSALDVTIKCVTKYVVIDFNCLFNYVNYLFNDVNCVLKCVFNLYDIDRLHRRIINDPTITDISGWSHTIHHVIECINLFIKFVPNYVVIDVNYPINYVFQLCVWIGASKPPFYVAGGSCSASPACGADRRVANPMTITNRIPIGFVLPEMAAM